jgi:hypothetical protein
MQGHEIFRPFFVMMALTLIVWIAMYVRRIAYQKAHRVHPQKVRTPDRVVAVMPEDVQYPAYNFSNLMELPILFYALCLYLYVTGSVDSLYVIAAWSFVGLRIVHSAIQCTTNAVFQRFIAYMASSLVLWFMVLRAALGAF